MAKDSVPDIAALADAYLAARYSVAIDGRDWPLSVGRKAGEVERRLMAGSYLFLTAWNPASRPAPDAENRRADERLRDRFREFGHAAHPARGGDADGGNAEPGWLALDLPPAEADALAREFGQLGSLYWRRGEPLRLRMLAPRPAGYPGHPHLDWVA
jgi:hypothetical protein